MTMTYNDRKTFVDTFTLEQKEVIKSFFTDSEWNAIDSALADYQDYGEEETNLMNAVGD